MRAAAHECLERGITQPPRATCGSRACNFALPQTERRGERAAAKTRGEPVLRDPRAQRRGARSTGQQVGRDGDGPCHPGEPRARCGQRRRSERAATRSGRGSKTGFMRNPKSKEIRTLIKGSAVLRGMGERESCGAGTELQGEGVGQGVLTMGPRRAAAFHGRGTAASGARRAARRAEPRTAMDGWMDGGGVGVCRGDGGSGELCLPAASRLNT